MKNNLKIWFITVYIISPVSLFATPLDSSAVNLIINTFLCIVFVGMLTLVLTLMRNLKALKSASRQPIQTGARWINQNLYSFDENQLRTLIQKINKSENNDKQTDAAI